jgi:hypothetical protein
MHQIRTGFKTTISQKIKTNFYFLLNNLNYILIIFSMSIHFYSIYRTLKAISAVFPEFSP